MDLQKLITAIMQTRENVKVLAELTGHTNRMKSYDVTDAELVQMVNEQPKRKRRKPAVAETIEADEHEKVAI